MKNRNLLLFFLVTIIVIVIAAVTSRLQSPRSNIEKSVLFPELADQLNDINRIEISGNNGKVILVKKNEEWLVASSANYPAIFQKVRAVALNLSQLRVVDEKTSNPEFYSRLGVEDPDQKDARSLLLTLFTGNNQVLASLIAGQPRQSSSSKPGLYVRMPDQKTALLVEGHLDISAINTDWFIRELIDIPSAVVKQVDIAYPSGKTFSIFKDSREQPDFESTDDFAAQSSASKIIINRIAKGLEELRADGVIDTDSFSFPENSTYTTYTTFDGIVTRIKLAMINDKAYAKFMFFSDDELAAEADAAAAASKLAETQEIQPVKDVIENLSSRLGSWIYQIPDFKYEALTSDLESLKKAIP